MSDIDLNFRPEDYFQNKENNEINMPLVSQTGFVNSGEYLPKLSANEIEICRLVLNSSSVDITSLRVRKNKDRYVYKIVDEHSSIFTLPIHTSVYTLTMNELIEIFDNCEQTGGDYEGIDNIGLIKPIVMYERIENKLTSEEVNQFIRVESSFYPEIENYYSSMIEKWIEEIDPENAGLEKKYIKFFGVDAEKPPKHIMKTLVEMKENGTFKDKIKTIEKNYSSIKQKVEKGTGINLSKDHPLFDIDFEKN